MNSNRYTIVNDFQVGLTDIRVLVLDREYGFLPRAKSLAKVETAEAYAAEMNRFLKVAEQYGIQFITGR